jgi:hypothetical protein
MHFVTVASSETAVERDFFWLKKALFCVTLQPKNID